MPNLAHYNLNTFLFGVANFRIRFSLKELLLALEFAPTFESPGVQYARPKSGLHGAARLVSMAAVAKSASRGKFVDFRESL
jgi:hypothetical protein